MAKVKLSPADFVHLHNHTQYSLLDGLTKVPALLDFVQDSGMQAVAITDHGTLSGVIEFYKEAKAREIKPILGMEAYMATRTIADRDPAKDKNYFHIILLAMNNTGYRNLMQLSTIASLEGVYYRPRIDHELLEKHNEGLIVLSGCIGGELGDALRQEQYNKARDIASWYKSVFGDRYYLEIQDHGHPDHPAKWDEQVTVTKQMLTLAKELDIPCVVTCDAHYLRHADQEAHEILLCVQTGSFLSDDKRMTLKNLELHVTEPKEIIKRWGADYPELITNTRAVSERCQVEIELGKSLIPKFPVPKGEDEKSYLDHLVYQGLAWRYAGLEASKAASLSITAARKLLPKNILERADYELGIINQMGFNGYFLIIADFINWGKEQGIVFGPGRGSAAGSIVSYSLNITGLDPLAYDLLFERFLNPDRISMPDIDIDIQDTRRDEVIQYCIEKYGKERVANIVTFGRMAARNAVRDVARVLQVPYIEADRWSKMIPPPIQGRHIPLSQSLKSNPELKAEYHGSESAKRVFDLATQLEGTIRSHGVHAAGVVIAPDDIVKFVPLEMAQKGVVATQYPMGPIDELGLLKIDFLGLSNLTIIKNALRIIKKVYHTDIAIDDIPLSDGKTFELLARGDTTGVFQLESAGMRRYLKELKPTVFDDIIAMVALYRPGPMAEIPRFIIGKNDAAKISYPHQSLKPVLKNTFGVMVYQEQIIALLQLIAGYTRGQADLVRKAIGKKKRDIMMAEQPKFIAGSLQQGLSQKEADSLWALIQPFADYSFPKAHAACYAMIAYQTAYLKANYPATFMAALMTSDYDNTDRLAVEINECQHMGIAVLPPDVNESFVEFAVVPGDSPEIRFGMNAIKNVGTAAVEEILRARGINGPFANLEAFLSNVSARIVNRKSLESLIKAGAFDRYGARATLLHNLDSLTAYAARRQKQAASGQIDFFGEQSSVVAEHAKLNLTEPVEPATAREQLIWERELLGLYLSQHPLEPFKQFLSEQSIPLNTITAEHDGRGVTIGGVITNVREITTKKGQKMAFITLEDQFGAIELLLFPKTYQQTAKLWERDRVIIAKGKLSARGRDGQTSDTVKLTVDEAREISIEQVENYQPTGQQSSKLAATKATDVPAIVAAPRVYIRLPDATDQNILLSLKQTIDTFHGDTEVVLVLGPDKNKQVIKLPARIQAHDEALAKLSNLAGAANVKVH